MTQEQFILYIYGIYPEGGFTITVVLLSVIMLFAWLPITEGGTEFNKSYTAWKKIAIPLFIITAITVVLSTIIPDKKTFLLLVATPTIIESYTEKGGKLNRLDSLIDKALKKADKALDEGK